MIWKGPVVSGLRLVKSGLHFRFAKAARRLPIPFFISAQEMGQRVEAAPIANLRNRKIGVLQELLDIGKAQLQQVLFEGASRRVMKNFTEIGG